ncbi:LPXTG cell wall anchor domain-containing protein, partial [Chloroflexota bacterium]
GTYTVVALDEDGEKGETTFTIITELIPEATPEVTVEPTVEDEPDETNSSWGTYALIGAGVLVVGILIFLLRRKTAYH